MPNPDSASRASVFQVLIVAALLLAAPVLFAHPDLLLQIERLDGEIAADPHNAELLASRGDLYRRHQDYAAAQEDFSAARAADPDYALLDFLEARLMLDTGRPQQARLRLDAYLPAHPGHAAAWMLRGQAWLGLGMPAPAAGDFSGAIGAAEKPSPELYRLLVLSLAAQGSDRAEAALDAVNDGLDQFPIEVSLLGLGVDIALGADRAGEAEHYFEQLPAALHALPQWKARRRLADCVGQSENPQSSACLLNARQHLADQVSGFLADHAPTQPSQSRPHH